MSFSHVVYIDEAGDEGFGKLKNPGHGGQSQWLLVGAAVVRGDMDPKLPSLRDAILGRFPKTMRRDLHFRYLKHDQKVVACQEIAKHPIFGAVLPGTDTRPSQVTDTDIRSRKLPLIISPFSRPFLGPCLWPGF